MIPTDGKPLTIGRNNQLDMFFAILSEAERSFISRDHLEATDFEYSSRKQLRTRMDM